MRGLTSLGDCWVIYDFVKFSANSPEKKPRKQRRDKFFNTHRKAWEKCCSVAARTSILRGNFALHSLGRSYVYKVMPDKGMLRARGISLFCMRARVWDTKGYNALLSCEPAALTPAAASSLCHCETLLLSSVIYYSCAHAQSYTAHGSHIMYIYRAETRECWCWAHFKSKQQQPVAQFLAYKTAANTHPGRHLIC